MHGCLTSEGDIPGRTSVREITSFLLTFLPWKHVKHTCKGQIWGHLGMFSASECVAVHVLNATPEL